MWSSYGRMEPPEPPAYPKCPVCGSEDYEYIFFDFNENVVGCSDCVRPVEAEDYYLQKEEESRSAWEDAQYDAYRDMMAERNMECRR